MVPGSYDTVLCIYVLNVKPYEEDRKAIEEKLIELLKPGGSAYIVVRGDKNELTGWKSTGSWQGFVTPTDRWKRIKRGRFRVYQYRKEIV